MASFTCPWASPVTQTGQLYFRKVITALGSYDESTANHSIYSSCHPSFQAMTWLSIQALGPDDLLSTSELPLAPTSPHASRPPTIGDDDRHETDDENGNCNKEGNISS